MHKTLVPLIFATVVSAQYPVFQEHRSRHHAVSHQFGQRAAPTLPSGYAYIGCVAEPSGSRVLSVQLSTSTSMTVTSCASACSSGGYSYAGLEYGNECWCGNSLNSPLAQPDSSCSTACAGDSTQKCGAGYILSLYGKPLPTWSTLGCYVDSGSNRDMSNGPLTSGAMTPTLCQLNCGLQGYNYAGVEAGTQCFCGNALGSAAGSSGASGCTTACGGDSSQICGGGFRINVYKSSAASGTGSLPTLPSGGSWTSLGCYLDSGTQRTLPYIDIASSTNTPAQCQAHCLAGGYSYAGTENGAQCWCGSFIPGISTSAAAPASQCNAACAGDGTQMCGGAYRMNIYSYGAGSTTTTTSVATTTTSSAPPNYTTGGWTYLGCYLEATGRLLPYGPYTPQGMTPGVCEAYCLAAAYPYAGVENGAQCFCGSTLPSGYQTSESACSLPCNGDPTVMCGAAYRLNIYYHGMASSSISTISSTSSHAPTTTTSIATATTTTSSAPPNYTTGGWSYLGCYLEATGRLLPYGPYTPKNMTPGVCETYCLAAGYPYAGVENGAQCFCGSTLPSGYQTSESACSLPCNGDLTVMCGAAWRLNIYYHVTVSTTSSISSTTSSTSTTTSSTGTTTSSTGTTTSSTRTTTTTSSSCSVTAAPSSYVQVGCYQDSYNRVLPVEATAPDTTSRTIAQCESQCAALGYPYAGLETGSECWCGNGIGQYSDSGSPIASSNCSAPCTGATSTTCGGTWALMIYYNAALDSGSCGYTGTSSAPPVVTGTPQATGNGWASYATNTAGKFVFAHFMVGNAYSYTPAQWLTEIKEASAQGIDAFALNMGQSPDWEPARMQDAYTAAAASGTGFKMFISFDMTAISCSSSADVSYISNLIIQFGTQAAQLKDASGNVLVSSFAGDQCYFGQGSITPGWVQAVKSGPAAAGLKTKFVPAFFSAPSSNSQYSSFMDGLFPWNNGWPMGDYDVPWSTDQYDISYVNRAGGQLYMAPISPWFFTHYSPASYNKNWIYRGDDWLYVTRWEQLIQNRGTVDLVEIITWNDYGESSYIGPIGADQPNSQAWVNGFPHTAWLTLTGYYATWYKTGVQPTITADKIYMWARPHGALDYAPDPACGEPANYTWTQDYLWVILFATAPGQLTLTQGSSTGTVSVVAGINKLKLASGVTSTGVTAVMTRNNVNAWMFSAPITFTHSPPTYNFNAFVFNGP